MTRAPDISAAFDWATRSPNAKTRGQRIIAWKVATQGPNSIKGASTVREAAETMRIPGSTMAAMLGDLRARFGVVVPCDDFANPVGDFERRNREEVGSADSIAEGADADWGLPQENET
jgi:hypothetical protein